MKSLIAGAAALALAAVAAPAFAQSLPTASVYGNVGGSVIDQSNVAVDALQARLGARFAKYFGVEGEAAIGLNTADVIDYKLRSEFAGYGVAFLPVLPNLDAFARVGYAHSNAKLAGVKYGSDSVNYGAGVQAFVTAKDGLRAEYTRFEFTEDGAGAANVWSLSYVRKFN
jgi:hypothetical protein